MTEQKKVEYVAVVFATRGRLPAMHLAPFVNARGFSPWAESLCGLVNDVAWSGAFPLQEDVPWTFCKRCLRKKDR